MGKRYDKDQYDQAIADYTKAIELNPGAYHEPWEKPPMEHIMIRKLAKAYYNRGLAQEAQGNMEMACSDWLWACEFGDCRNRGVITKIRCYLMGMGLFW